MIFVRHPRHLLARAAEGRLDGETRARLDAHLARCAICREELEAVRRAADALRAAPILPPPPGARARLLAAADVDRVGVARGGAPRHLGRAAVFAATALAAATGLVVAIVPARVRVVPGEGDLSAFERRAAALHRELREEAPSLDLSSDDAAQIRSWLRREGLSADLASVRPAGDAASYRLLGARAAGDAERPAAAIATRIDGVPVTLLVGRERDVDGIPAWGWIGKRLLVRHDAERGVHLLSWRNAGKAYTLVTDPGVAPARACQLCHVDARRRRAIEKVAEQL